VTNSLSLNHAYLQRLYCCSRFSHAGYPSCRSTNNAKAPKELKPLPLLRTTRSVVQIFYSERCSHMNNLTEVVADVHDESAIFPTTLTHAHSRFCSHTASKHDRHSKTHRKPSNMNSPAGFFQDGSHTGITSTSSLVKNC